MDPSNALSTPKVALPLDRIADLCRKYGVADLAVFGSTLRDDFRPDSDVDFLVSFQHDDYGPWMSKLTDLEAELSVLIGRKADVVSKTGVERSENYIRRRHILSSARPVYVAG